ncbi:hypothetical protein Dimus_003517 [Dionaea muscipula]
MLLCLASFPPPPTPPLHPTNQRQVNSDCLLAWCEGGSNQIEAFNPPIPIHLYTYTGFFLFRFPFFGFSKLGVDGGIDERIEVERLCLNPLTHTHTHTQRKRKRKQAKAKW